ncbi:type I-E CRISPR-associated protein Cas5/CasD [Desulfohalovibrio reitneri]|uniref:type I-E CRISPR-associated protein Cas5/CasD n=1 Tax=Desulfohalovibrio reitneri TaxID=1307759 RepID=UPI0006899460|nr:type I-E CRISPR-associated protein Cas5/CasD [Desulfohalovibrio reitneri]
MRCVLFTIYGPLCSWGSLAVAGVRRSWGHPSKSAILGLVAGALGYKRSAEDDHASLERDWALAVRVDSPGTALLDYHTVQYPPAKGKRTFHTRRDELGQKLADGEQPETKVLSQREYLQDAAFTVCLLPRADQPKDSAEAIRDALNAPRFTPYLGRRSCPRPCPSWPKWLTRKQPRKPCGNGDCTAAWRGPCPSSSNATCTWRLGCQARRTAITSWSAATPSFRAGRGSSPPGWNGAAPCPRRPPHAGPSTGGNMMYLSRAWITDAAEACRLARAGFYENHRAVWRLFADHPNRDRDFLYRRQDERTSGHRRRHPDGGAAEFLIVSARPPRQAPGWRVETKDYDPDLTEGDRLHFSLRANPTRVVTQPGGKKKRVDVVMHAKHQLKEQGTAPEDLPPQAVLAHNAGCAWLRDRAPALGLELDESSLRADGYQLHQRAPSGGKKPIRFASLDFSGLARVADAEALRAALFSGVGKSKGFGCGLLLVRRA